MSDETSETGGRILVIYDFGAYQQHGSVPADENVYVVSEQRPGPRPFVEVDACTVVHCDAATWAAHQGTLASGMAYVREGDRAIPVRLA